MVQDTGIFLGASRKPDDSYQKAEELLLRYGNRHGMVTGATGTGKTVTLQILAEGFSNAGVPVFSADVKGAGNIAAILAGAAIGLAVHPVWPDWSLLAGGVVGGSIAFVIGEKFGVRRSKPAEPDSAEP